MRFVFGCRTVDGAERADKDRARLFAATWTVDHGSGRRGSASYRRSSFMKDECTT